MYFSHVVFAGALKIVQHALVMMLHSTIKIICNDYIEGCANFAVGTGKTTSAISAGTPSPHTIATPVLIHVLQHCMAEDQLSMLNIGVYLFISVSVACG